MKYKNTSLAAKQFWGITFKAGEIKDVPGFINDPKFIRMPDDHPISKPSVSSKSTSSVSKSDNSGTVDTKPEAPQKLENIKAEVK